MHLFGRRAGLRHADLITAPGRRPLAVPPQARPRKEQQPAQEESTEDKPPPKRLSKLFEKYNSSDLETQQAEALNYAAERAAATEGIPKRRDGRPVSRTPRATKFSESTAVIESKHAAMFAYDPSTRKEEPIVGIYGNGEPQWWALRVNPGREKQVADAIDRQLSLLPLLEGDIEREVESWVPAKKVRAWSPKTKRMGAKSLKYEDGGWLLVRTVMDKPFYSMLSGNINVLGFIDREVFEGTEFPRPASPDLLSTIQEWESDLSDITEDQVKAQLGVDTVRLAPTVDAREEFFYDEDVEAMRKIQEEREFARAGRGHGRGDYTSSGRDGRGGRGMRGRGGARTGGVNGFFPADQNYRSTRDRRDRDEYQSRDNDDSSSTYRSSSRDGWDQPRRKQRDDRSRTNSGGSEWYDGTAGRKEESVVDDGWFTGGAVEKGSAGSDLDSFGGDAGADSGWFANSSGGLLSDDDYEVWSGASGAKGTGSTAANTGIDLDWGSAAAADIPPPAAPAANDMDAVWGQGTGGSGGEGYSGWLDEGIMGGSGSGGGGRERSNYNNSADEYSTNTQQWKPRESREQRYPRSYDDRDRDGGYSGRGRGRGRREDQFGGGERGRGDRFSGRGRGREDRAERGEWVDQRRSDRGEWNSERGGEERGERGSYSSRRDGGDRDFGEQRFDRGGERRGGRWGDRDRDSSDRPPRRRDRDEGTGTASGTDGWYSPETRSGESSSSSNRWESSGGGGGDDLSWWDDVGGTSTSTSGTDKSSTTESTATTPQNTSDGPKSENIDTSPSSGADKGMSTSYSSYGGSSKSSDGASKSASSAPKKVKKGEGLLSTSFGEEWGGEEWGGGPSTPSSESSAGVPSSDLPSGTRVRVVSGRFQDFDGVVTESKDGKLRTELDVFGTPTVVEVSRGEVVPDE